MKHYAYFWRRYAEFRGKTTVAGFWVALAMHYLIVFAIFVLLLVVFAGPFNMQSEDSMLTAYVVLDVYSLVCICPLLAITVRRLRDAGFSWRSLLWLLLPGIGMVALIVRLCTKSTVL